MKSQTAAPKEQIIISHRALKTVHEDTLLEWLFGDNEPAARKSRQAAYELGRRQESWRNMVSILIAAITAIAGAAAAYAAIQSFSAMKDANRLAQEVAYLTSVNTRIQTCTALAAHHGQLKDFDGPTETSSNTERRDKSANLSRALDLCLIVGNGVRACIEKLHENRAYLVNDPMPTLAC